MNIFQKIKKYFEQSSESIAAPEAYCPNCWGRQEYGGQLLEAVRNEKIDLNNIDQKKGWIDAYAIRYFEGIKLKKINEELICEACGTSYRPA